MGYNLQSCSSCDQRPPAVFGSTSFSSLHLRTLEINSILYQSAFRREGKVSSVITQPVCPTVCLSIRLSREGRHRSPPIHFLFLPYSPLVPPSCSPDRKIAISSPTKATATRINMEAAGATSEIAALDVDNFPNIRSTQPKNPRKPS